MVRYIQDFFQTVTELMIYSYDYPVKEKTVDAGQWRSSLFPISVNYWKPSYPLKLIFKAHMWYLNVA